MVHPTPPPSLLRTGRLDLWVHRHRFWLMLLGEHMLLGRKAGLPITTGEVAVVSEVVSKRSLLYPIASMLHYRGVLTAYKTLDLTLHSQLLVLLSSLSVSK
jgi:hypothetical protein